MYFRYTNTLFYSLSLSDKCLNTCQDFYVFYLNPLPKTLLGSGKPAHHIDAHPGAKEVDIPCYAAIFWCSTLVADYRLHVSVIDVTLFYGNYWCIRHRQLPT